MRKRAGGTKTKSQQHLIKSFMPGSGAGSTHQPQRPRLLSLYGYLGIPRPPFSLLTPVFFPTHAFPFPDSRLSFFPTHAFPFSRLTPSFFLTHAGIFPDSCRPFSRLTLFLFPDSRRFRPTHAPDSRRDPCVGSLTILGSGFRVQVLEFN